MNILLVHHVFIGKKELDVIQKKIKECKGKEKKWKERKENTGKEKKKR